MSILFIVVFFCFLWIPLGQHEFLFEDWMKIGVFMAPFVLFVAFAFRAKNRSIFDAQNISLFLLVAYIAHQFEEHWVDLYGRYYAFKPFLNHMLLERVGAVERSGEILSDAGVFLINTSLVWLVGALAIWRAPQHVFPALCMAAIVLTNALSHIAAAAFSGAYNPGLLTAIILFSPLGAGAYALLLKTSVARPVEIGASLLWGLLAHFVMIAGMIASGWFKILSEPVYFAILVAWSISPVLLFRRAAGNAVPARSDNGQIHN